MRSFHVVVAKSSWFCNKMKRFLTEPAGVGRCDLRISPWAFGLPFGHTRCTVSKLFVHLLSSRGMAHSGSRRLIGRGLPEVYDRPFRMFNSGSGKGGGGGE